MAMNQETRLKRRRRLGGGLPTVPGSRAEVFAPIKTTSPRKSFPRRPSCGARARRDRKPGSLSRLLRMPSIVA